MFILLRKVRMLAFMWFAEDFFWQQNACWQQREKLCGQDKD